MRELRNIYFRDVSIMQNHRKFVQKFRKKKSICGYIHPRGMSRGVSDQEEMVYPSR